MLPTLPLGPLALPTYPFFLLLAFWAALAIGAWAAPRRGLEGDHVYNAGLYGLAAGLVVGRAGHVIAFWPAYRHQPLDIIGLNGRAFLLWPALVAAALCAGWYIHRHRLSWAALLDALTPGVLAAVALISIGALLDGRPLGAVTDAPWAVQLWGVARQPSQVYEAAASLAVMAVTLAALRGRPRPGRVAWLGLLGYGLSRWLLEPFRAAEVSPTLVGGLRSAQVAGLAAALVALWALRRLSRR